MPSVLLNMPECCTLNRVLHPKPTTAFLLSRPHYTQITQLVEQIAEKINLTGKINLTDVLKLLYA